MFNDLFRQMFDRFWLHFLIILGPNWTPLAPFGSLLAPFWPPLAPFWSHWLPFGPLWLHFGSILAPRWHQKAILNRCRASLAPKRRTDHALNAPRSILGSRTPEFFLKSARALPGGPPQSSHIKRLLILNKMEGSKD